MGVTCKTRSARGTGGGERLDFGRLAMECARLTMTPWAPDRTTAIATIHAALDAGVTYLDTASCYADSHRDAGANEELVADALATWSGDRDSVFVGTKGGRRRDDSGTWVQDGRPDALRASCERSLQALRTDRIGLYWLHGPDPSVPFAESLWALADLRAEGKVDRIGMCDVTLDQVVLADAILGVAAVQDGISPSRCRPAAAEMAARCGEVGVPFLADGPLPGVGTDVDEVAHRGFVGVARDLGVSVRQVALAWVRSAGPSTVPLFGPTSPAQVAEGVAALDLDLPASELARLPALAPDDGTVALSLRERTPAGPGPHRPG